MTSLAFTLGVMPLYLATGAGAEMRIALGTAVFWGMIGVTLFGLDLHAGVLRGDPQAHWQNLCQAGAEDLAAAAPQPAE